MIMDIIGNQTSQHCALREKDRPKRIRDTTHKAKAPGSIRVCRNQVQRHSRNLPQKTIPDQKSHVPAKQNELEDGNAYEDIPDACRSKIPPPARHGIPRGCLNSKTAVPEPQSEGVYSRE